MAQLLQNLWPNTEPASAAVLEMAPAFLVRPIESRVVGVRLAVPSRSTALPSAEGTASRTPTVIAG